LREHLSVIALRETLRMGFIVPIAFFTMAHLLEFLERRVVDWWRTRHLAQDVTAAVDEQAVHELRALRAELNPHFLGNALHAIGGLVRSAPADAVVLIEQTRTLLARLGTTDNRPATLAAECDQLGLFLAVARARYGPALTLEVELAADTRDAVVPALLLQPLVENAVKHGMAPQGGGTIRIGAHRDGRDLVVTVADNGAGLKAHGNVPGIGLAHTRERLSGRYGAGATVTLVPNTPTGAVATVRLPFTHAA
jgi:LytS/YehU family sensor histidine kinase